MLVEVDDLRVSFRTPAGVSEAVRGVSFTMGAEKIGIVGESGSGKSLTARSVLRLLPAAARVQARRLAFDGVDVLTARERAMRAIRGKRAGLILQDPKFSLNPVMRVGEQVAAALRAHGGVGRRQARERAVALLESVAIREPARVARLYPHELSGGMGQRVMIAMMLAPGPELLIADEPTSALDATVQAGIVRLLEELCSVRGMGLLLISHDLPLVGHVCDRVLVMYAGRVVEEVRGSELARATHPYTRGLLACLPRLTEKRGRLAVLRRDAGWAA